jgi:hypothetical protein
VVVASNSAIVSPAGTLTLAGTVTIAGLLLVSITSVPPDGAACLICTVPTERFPPGTGFGLKSRRVTVLPAAKILSVPVRDEAPSVAVTTASTKPPGGGVVTT